jgi:hypothetical protein
MDLIETTTQQQPVNDNDDDIDPVSDKIDVIPKSSKPVNKYVDKKKGTSRQNNNYVKKDYTRNNNNNNNRYNNRVEQIQQQPKDETAIHKFENNFDKAKRRSFFDTAKENASNRMFQVLKLDPEDLTNFFSVEQDEHGNGVASREEYDWIYKTTGDADNIPLDEYIQQPSRYMDGKRIPIIFRVSFFFKNPDFLKRCKSYYRKYNIDFKIIKLKTPDLWKIILKVVDPNNIIIKAEN